MKPYKGQYPKSNLWSCYEMRPHQASALAEYKDDWYYAMLPAFGATAVTGQLVPFEEAFSRLTQSNISSNLIWAEPEPAATTPFTRMEVD